MAMVSALIRGKSTKKNCITSSFAGFFDFSPKIYQMIGKIHAVCMKIPHTYPPKKRENRVEISKTGFVWKNASFGTSM